MQMILASLTFTFNKGIHHHLFKHKILCGIVARLVGAKLLVRPKTLTASFEWTPWALNKVCLIHYCRIVAFVSAGRH